MDEIAGVHLLMHLCYAPAVQGVLQRIMAEAFCLNEYLG